VKSALNKSGITPVGRAVLLKSYQPERAASVIALPPGVVENSMALEARAIVIEIGEHAWHDEPGPRCDVGQKVMVSQFSGKLVRGPLDDELYRLVNDRDIYATIEEKSE
jgi:co-chaperonin GroES (HSP10)